MIVGDKQHARHVGHGQTYERYGTTEGGNHGREQSGDDEQPVAHAHHPDTQVLGIALAQHEGIERLDHEQGAQQAGQRDGGKGGQHAQRDAAKRAHAPDDV